MKSRVGSQSFVAVCSFHCRWARNKMTTIEPRINTHTHNYPQTNANVLLGKSQNTQYEDLRSSIAMATSFQCVHVWTMQNCVTETHLWYRRKVHFMRRQNYDIFQCVYMHEQRRFVWQKSRLWYRRSVNFMRHQACNILVLHSPRNHVSILQKHGRGKSRSDMRYKVVERNSDGGLRDACSNLPGGSSGKGMHRCPLSNA